MGELSNYVVNQLPDILSNIESGDETVNSLINTAEVLVNELTPEITDQLLNEKYLQGVD